MWALSTKPRTLASEIEKWTDRLAKVAAAVRGDVMSKESWRADAVFANYVGMPERALA